VALRPSPVFVMRVRGESGEFRGWVLEIRLVYVSEGGAKVCERWSHYIAIQDALRALRGDCI
jgi:hypothetical protein